MKKYIDGIEIEMTANEIAEKQASDDAWTNRVIPEPQKGPLVKITELLVEKGILKKADADVALSNAVSESALMDNT